MRVVPGWRVVEIDKAVRTVRIPSGVVLDLGATAKALAADRAATRIHEDLGCGVLVSLGGDISTAGEAPMGGWSIGVCDDGAAGPNSVEGQTVSLSCGALATSSTQVRRWAGPDGEERHHIIDPRLGRSARAGLAHRERCRGLLCGRQLREYRGHRAPRNGAGLARVPRASGPPRRHLGRGEDDRRVARRGRGERFPVSSLALAVTPSSYWFLTRGAGVDHAGPSEHDNGARHPRRQAHPQRALADGS